MVDTVTVPTNGVSHKSHLDGIAETPGKKWYFVFHRILGKIHRCNEAVMRSYLQDNTNGNLTFFSNYWDAHAYALKEMKRREQNG